MSSSTEMKPLKNVVGRVLSTSIPKDAPGPFFAYELEHITGIFTAWGNVFRICEEVIGRGDCVRVDGMFNSEQRLMDIQRIRKAEDLSLEERFNLLPVSAMARPELAGELFWFVRRTKNKFLRTVAMQFLTDPKVQEPFLCVGASRSDHHNGHSGLLDHSLEMAHSARELKGLNRYEAEVLGISCLGHDIAKAVLFAHEAPRTPTEEYFGHEFLSHLIIEPYIRENERLDPQAAADLRSVLAVPMLRNFAYRGDQKLPNLLQQLDRESAAGARKTNTTVRHRRTAATATRTDRTPRRNSRQGQISQMARLVKDW